eukprot:TRINITY_DN1858_c0_g1_i1.p1 TRINITY_DN1858_c0_g1~~TRINITY_DN1858_c0_g1_i1.p1  ORF type:complete len:241 (-),score=44.15 TRINITY_DN1858_c0_g1_i1:823-1467(-)
MEVELDFKIAPPSPAGRLAGGVGAAPRQTITLDSDVLTPELLASLKERLDAGKPSGTDEFEEDISFFEGKSSVGLHQNVAATPCESTESAAALLRGTSTTAPEESQQYHISLVSLNACLWPWGLRQSIHDNQKLQRAEGIAELCKKYDIVCLQEVFTSVWDKQWPEVLKSEHLNYARADGREKWHILDTFVHFFSVLFLLRSNNLIFQWFASGY